MGNRPELRDRAGTVLWLALVVGMVLHFNYDMTGLRYGVDIALPGADGTVPWSNFVIKALFYDLPFLVAVACVGAPGRGFRGVNLALAFLFLLANVAHVVITAMRATDVLGYAQILLLVCVALANAQLCRLSRRWWRTTAAE